MKKELIIAINSLFDKFPFAKSETVPYEEIEEAFSRLNFTLPINYKEFIHLYGGATVGPYSVYGLRASETMGLDEKSTLEVTDRYKSDGWFSKEWFDRENVLVISSDLSGNPIILDSEGKIWLLDHDLGSTELIADNFEEFLSEWCLKNIE